MVVVDHYYYAKDTYFVDGAKTVKGAIAIIENSEKTTYLIHSEQLGDGEYYVFLTETSEGIQVNDRTREVIK
jgi:hypothetical protein